LIRFSQFEALQNPSDCESINGSWTPEQVSLSSLPALKIAMQTLIVRDSRLQDNGLESISTDSSIEVTQEISCIRRTCQERSVALHIPHESLLQEGGV
jgi:hypothetical protein